MIEKINQYRRYLDYYEEHYNNIQKAWELIKEKCSDMSFMHNQNMIKIIDNEIKYHDASKLSAEEFIAYRQYFYPCSWEQKNKKQYVKARKHHKKHNDHHWRTWTNKYNNVTDATPHLITMIADWVAIGFKFGTSANKYYKDNIKNIKLPDWAVIIMNEVFKRIYE